MATNRVTDPLAGMAHSEVHYFNRYTLSRKTGDRNS